MQVINNPDFNKIFKDTFDELEFHLNKKLNVENVIDLIEGIDNEDLISVEYEQSDTSNCQIRIKGFSGEIILDEHTFKIQVDRKETPQNLIISCQGAYQALGQQGMPKMLE